MTDWISAFLIRRKQRGVIGENNSSRCDVDIRVPQGSDLETLLFILYINDLPDNLTCKFKLKADDGKLMLEIEADRDDDDMQSDLNRIVK